MQYSKIQDMLYDNQIYHTKSANQISVDRQTWYIRRFTEPRAYHEARTQDERKDDE